MSRTKITILALVSVLGLYICADAWDIVPGWYTLQEPQNKAAAYPAPEAGAVIESLDLPSRDYSEIALPAAAALQQKLNQLQQDKRMSGKVSAIVIDAPSKKVLANLDAQRPAVPASTNKILTAAAALQELGPDAQFPTQVKLAGKKLYLVGGGDILLAADKGNKDKVVGYSGLGDLARAAAAELKKKQITSVDLAVDESLFSGPDWVDGLGETEQNWVMESSPLAINRNFREPPYPEPHPGQVAGEVFRQHLEAAGIEANLVPNAAAPEKATEIARVLSAPLREIIEICLKESDNSLAETLGHLLAAAKGERADFVGAGKSVKAVLAEQGYSLTGINLADSSGLSEQNRLTASLLGQVLQGVWDCDKCSLAALPAGLPVASLRGTLRDRFHSTNMAGKVRAKTGSLENVSSLAGFIYTKAGRPLIFAIIADDIKPGTLYGARVAIDEAVATLAE